MREALTDDFMENVMELPESISNSDDHSELMSRLMNDPQPNFARIEQAARVSPKHRMFPKVLLAVMSAPKNVDHRRAIRNSWMRYLVPNAIPSSMTREQQQRITCSFFIGTPIGSNADELEQQLENEPDIVRLDMNESYHNLTLKTRMMMEYASKNDYDFMFKLDDDNFVRVDLFVQKLQTFQSLEDLYWGRWKRNVPVIKDPTQKWFDGKFNQSTYPDYMLGSGYVVGRTILNFVANNSESLTLYENEDASVGIWVQSLALHRANMDQMVLQPWCNQDAIVVNGLEIDEYELLMNHAIQFNNICAENFYPRVCQDTPCQCCVDPTKDKFSQKDDVCCY
eukprot:c2623_g1_i1.p1 GENE.c2623_g1_i1~~c2623_g1_i1.p1  ORF type:complete len:365 (-),score=57.92 c2623_g1_i1:43-1059(-)